MEKIINVVNTVGLHASLASKLVQAAGQFEAEVKLVYADQVVDAKSILGLMSLAIPSGLGSGSLPGARCFFCPQSAVTPPLYILRCRQTNGLAFPRTQRMPSLVVQAIGTMDLFQVFVRW